MITYTVIQDKEDSDTYQFYAPGMITRHACAESVFSCDETAHIGLINIDDAMNACINTKVS